MAIATVSSGSSNTGPTTHAGYIAPVTGRRKDDGHT